MNNKLRLNNPIRKQLAKQLSQRPNFPAGHTIGIAYARVFGPKMKMTPEGHPITISSGPFDNTVETAAHAIARAGRKWHSIEIHEPSWILELEEDIIHPVGRPAIPYTKFYHFRYEPEAAMWKHKGLHDGNVTNHFKQSHYLTRNWQRRGSSIDQALATSLIPAAPQGEIK